jgi:6-phosphogluconate dehydrogenase
LISIGADLSHKRDNNGDLVISKILGKVVQDITGEEGTGIWSNTEAIEQHVPAFTMNSAHLFRLASAYRGDRERSSKVSHGGFPPQELTITDKEASIEDLRKATYAACLASYIQGMNVISRANQQHEWNINYANVWQIWRAGCIIQTDYISDHILKPILCSPNPPPESINLVFNPRTMDDVRKCFPSLRRVVAKAVETDQVAPALSATLDYFKVVTGTDLPTSFYEAELDYFGKHMYDVKGDKNVGGPTEGKHHFEWKPATSQTEVYGKNGQSKL